MTGQKPAGKSTTLAPFDVEDVVRAWRARR